MKLLPGFRLWERHPGFKEGLRAMLNLRNKANALDFGERQNRSLRDEFAITIKDLRRKACLTLQELEEDQASLTEVLQGRSLAEIRTQASKGLIYFLLLSILSVAYFALTVWGLQPLDMAWKTYLIAGALVIIGAIVFELLMSSLEKTIPEQNLRRGVVITCMIGVTAIACTVLLLGYLRALLHKLLLSLDQGLSSGDLTQATASPARLADLAFILWPLAGLAFEICAGLLLYHGLKNWLASAQALGLQKRIKARTRMLLALARKVQELEAYPEQWWLGFQNGVEAGEVLLRDSEYMEVRAFLRKALLITAAIILAVIFFLLLASVVFSAEPRVERHGRAVLIGLDLTGSSSSRDRAGNEIFAKNLRAVGAAIRKAKPGDQIWVVAITEETFTNPLILSKETIPRKPKTFRERIRQKSLAVTWPGLEKRLKPLVAGSTDVLGLFLLAEQIFTALPGEKVLIIISDMVHTAEPGFKAILNKGPNLIKALPKPDLTGTRIWVYGAGTPCMSKRDWIRLRDFWKAYIKACGAELVLYTNLREIRHF